MHWRFGLTYLSGCFFCEETTFVSLVATARGMASLSVQSKGFPTRAACPMTMRQAGVPTWANKARFRIMVRSPRHLRGIGRSRPMEVLANMTVVGMRGVNIPLTN
jgi:hypothetical protein